MSKILHFGVGNFSRAHQFWYTQNANENWRITGVSLRRPDVRDHLRDQEFDYTLAIYGPGRADFERISILDDILVGPEDPQKVVQAVAAPNVAIITITVTEKGYAIDPATGSVDDQDPQIKEDLKSATPGSLLSYLAHGLAMRKERHSLPVTILSCDNLSGNGDRLRSGVTSFAARAGLEIGDYLDRSVTFPNTMVDRITPATTDALKSDVLNCTGWPDQAPVATEYFSEWIIEDRFCSPRPDWERAGARLVSDVTPYELRKLRLLNGPHSLLAYLGQLRGHRFVHEAIADADIQQKVRGMMQEAIATLPEPIKSESPAYCDALISRFANPALEHSLKQIAMDGTEKLPIRIVPVLKQLISDSIDAPFAIDAVACWIAYAIRQNAEGMRLDDPKAGEIIAIGQGTGSPQEEAQQLLALLIPDLSETEITDQIAARAVQLAAI